MANSLGEMVVRILGDSSQFDSSIDKSKKNFKAAAESFTKIGKSLSLFVTAPLTALGVVAIKTGADFEMAMNKVQAISGATEEQFKKLKDQARELGATTQFTASQSADAMSFLAMAGFDVNKIYGVMPDTLNLAAAAQLDMGTAADIVSNIMAGFGLEADDLGESVDILTKAFTTSNTDLRQLGEAMKYAGPVAKSVGLSVAETAAAIGQLSNAGIQGSMAGTGLRRILSALLQKSDELGISMYDAAGKMKPFGDIIEQLEIRGLSAAESMEIFGERGGPSMQVLLESGSAKIKEMTKLLEESGGVAENIANIQMRGLNGQLKILRSVTEEAGISISEILAPAITGIVSKLTDLINWFNGLNDTAKENILIIVGVAAAMGPLAVGIGSVMKVLPALITALTTGLTATGVVGLVIVAVAALVSGILILINTIKGAKKAQEDLNKILEGGTTGSWADDLKLVNERMEKVTKEIEKSNRMVEAGNNYEITHLNQLKEEYEALNRTKIELAEKQKWQALNQRGQEAMNEQVTKETVAQDKINEALEIREKITEKYLGARENVLSILENERTEYDKLEEEINRLEETPWAQGQLENDRLEAIKVLRQKQQEIIDEEIESEKEKNKQILENTQNAYQELNSYYLSDYETQIQLLLDKQQAFIDSGVSQADAYRWYTDQITVLNEQQAQKELESIKKRKEWWKDFYTSTSSVAKSTIEAIGKDLSRLQIDWKNVGTAAIQSIGRIISALGDELAAKAAARLVEATAAAVSIFGAPAAPGLYTSAAILSGGAAAAWAAGAALQNMEILGDGGLVQPRSGGVPAILAERGVPELVVPLDKLDQVLNKVSYPEKNNQMQHTVINLDGQPLLDLVYQATQNKTLVIDSGAII